jgi:hypothetical protein
MKIDVHQHLWTEPLVQALAAREELPFVRREHGLTVLFMAGERPYVIERSSETSARRAELVEGDGLDRALICLSSPLGIESLPREQAQPLIDAYHDGALALGEPFGVWGAIALDRAAPADVDHALQRGCVGISLPAGALASVDDIAQLDAVLDCCEQAGAPVMIHPGPGLHERRARRPASSEPSLSDPLWWSALTRYVSDMQAAWLAFVSAGRPEHPRLRVVFTMLAGLAPLHAERLRARGGPTALGGDALTFYETSSYGPAGLRGLAAIVGEQQLLYGSDRPVVDPAEHGTLQALDWDAVSDATQRALRRPRTPGANASPRAGVMPLAAAGSRAGESVVAP